MKLTCENELRFTCMQVFTVNLLVFKSVHIPIFLPIHPFNLSVCLQALSLCIHPFNLSVYLSACLSVSLTSLFVCLFIHNICLSKNRPSVYPTICSLSVSLLVFVFIHMCGCMSINLPFCPTVSLCVCPLSCLSASIYVCVFGKWPKSLEQTLFIKMSLDKESLPQEKNKKVTFCQERFHLIRRNQPYT